MKSQQARYSLKKFRFWQQHLGHQNSIKKRNLSSAECSVKTTRATLWTKRHLEVAVTEQLESDEQ